MLNITKFNVVTFFKFKYTIHIHKINFTTLKIISRKKQNFFVKAEFMSKNRKKQNFMLKN